MSDKNSSHRRKNKTPKVYVELDLKEFKDIVRVKECETMYEKEHGKERKHNNKKNNKCY